MKSVPQKTRELAIKACRGGLNSATPEQCDRIWFALPEEVREEYLKRLGDGKPSKATKPSKPDRVAESTRATRKVDADEPKGEDTGDTNPENT